MSTHQQPTWNARRKAAVAVLVLAGAALGIDRFVLGVSGPGTASAQSYAIDAKSNAIKSNAISEGPVLDVKQVLKGNRDEAAIAVTLAQRLEAVKPSTKVQPSQMFIAPLGFFPIVEEPRSAANASAASERSNVPSVPLPKLTAVITGSNAGAILDGRLQRLGEVRDGVTLISVSDRSAVVRTSQSDVVLTIEDSVR